MPGGLIRKQRTLDIGRWPLGLQPYLLHLRGTRYISLLSFEASPKENFPMQFNWLTIAAIIIIVLAVGFLLMKRRQKS